MVVRARDADACAQRLLLLLLVTLDGVLRCVALPSCRTLWQHRLYSSSSNKDEDDVSDDEHDVCHALVHVDGNDAAATAATTLCDAQRWCLQWPLAGSSGSSASSPQWRWRTDADTTTTTLSCRDAVAHAQLTSNVRAYSLHNRRERYLELSLCNGHCLVDTHNGSSRRRRDAAAVTHVDDDDGGAVLCVTLAHDTVCLAQQRRIAHDSSNSSRRRGSTDDTIAHTLQLHCTHVLDMQLASQGDGGATTTTTTTTTTTHDADVVCFVNGEVDVTVRDGWGKDVRVRRRVCADMHTDSNNNDDNCSDRVHCAAATAASAAVVAAYVVVSQHVAPRPHHHNSSSRHANTSCEDDEDDTAVCYALHPLPVHTTHDDDDHIATSVCGGTVVHLVTSACDTCEHASSHQQQQQQNDTTTTATMVMTSTTATTQHDTHTTTSCAATYDDKTSSNNNEEDDDNNTATTTTTTTCEPWLAVPPPVTAGAALTSFFDDHYDPLRVLGSGASGAVLLVRHRVTGVFYAVKVLVVRDYASERAVLQEVRLHSVLEHRFLVRYHASWSEVVTPRRAQQLAMIGLCHPREAGIAEAATTTTRTRVHRIYDDNNSSIDNDDDTDATDDMHRHVLSWGSLPPPQQQQQTQYAHDGRSNSASYTQTTSTPRVRIVNDDDSSSNTIEQEQQAQRRPAPVRTPRTRQQQQRHRGEDDDNDDAAAVTAVQLPHKRSIVGARVVFLQMEYCQTTLKEYLATRSGVDRVLNLTIALQLIAALRYMHRMGVLHRDLKATNVFLSFRCQLLPPGVLDSDDSSDSDCDSEEDNSNDDDDDDEEAVEGGHRRTRRQGNNSNRNNGCGGGVYSGALMPMTSSALFTPYGVRFGLDSSGGGSSNNKDGLSMHYASSKGANDDEQQQEDGSVAVGDGVLLQPPHRTSDEMLRMGSVLWAQRLRRSVRTKHRDGATTTTTQHARSLLLPPLTHTSNNSTNNVVTTTTTTATASEHIAQHVVRWLRRSLVQTRLGDFGLAKSVHTNNSTTTTQQPQQHAAADASDEAAAGAVTELVDDEDDTCTATTATVAPVNTVGVGTPLYASPEQLRGDVCTGASDAFSLGVLLAEMYLQPTTMSERIVRLQRVRNDGVLGDDDLVRAYPELAVVRELTRPLPLSRMRLSKARAQLHAVLLECVREFVATTTRTTRTAM